MRRRQPPLGTIAADFNPYQEFKEDKMTKHSKHSDPPRPNHAPPPQEDPGEAAPSAAAPEAATATGEAEGLKMKLAEAEDAKLRLLAEMDNQRKRMYKDMEALRLSVLSDTLFPFLQVFDHFTMAVSAAGASDNLKSLLDGMKMIQTEFDKAFNELGVVKVDAVGKDFDPTLHDAVSEESSGEAPAGRVLRQWSCGYKVGERLLKPARVVVCSGPPSAAKT